VTETRTVEIGLEGDLFTEITAGLTAGEQVVVTATDTGDDGGFPFPGGGGFPGGGFPGGGDGPPGGGGGPGGGG
jgi:macrolide-specific efflux system membrane fusion protein